MANHEHFETIYNGHKKLVYNVCLHYVLNSADAEDITQEVFVKVYQKYPQYNASQASLKTWIYRITINHCLDFLKARNAKKRVGFLSALLLPNSNEPVIDMASINHPGTETEDKAALKQLLQIIYSLPPNQKTAIILSKIEDRPQKEVAEIMGMSVKAVESLMQRAKQTIQKKLTDSEGL